MKCKRYVAVTLVMFALGCERGKDRAAEHLIEKAIEAHGREARVDIDRPHGSLIVTLGSAIRPAAWPEPMPFYPRARRAKVEQESPGARTLLIVSDDPPAAVSQFYRRELSSAGWELTSPAAVNDEWRARRQGETVRFRASSRGARGSRTEVEYRARS
jgi:hypothetical protein